MPSEKEVLAALQAAIIDCDEDAAKAAAQAVLAAGVDPAKAIELAIGGAAEEVGKKFDSGEYFLPHLVMAADAMTIASDVLTAAIPLADQVAKKIVIIGTVEADLHSVGKNIVAMMMKSGGFDVYDLGVDVKSTAFVSAARDKGADIIALSSLMSTTMPYQREVIEDLAAAGVREKFKVMVGGGPVTKAWADEIGADGYGTDAVEALAVAKQLTGIAVVAPAR